MRKIIYLLYLILLTSCTISNKINVDYSYVNVDIYREYDKNNCQYFFYIDSISYTKNKIITKILIINDTTNINIDDTYSIFIIKNSILTEKKDTLIIKK